MRERSPVVNADLDILEVAPEASHQFAGLLALSFDREITADYFRWKYLDNPAGRVLGFAAFSNGEPVSFYGVIPEIYLIGDEPLRIYQSMDTMTHPNFRRRGLFVTLALRTYELIEQQEGRCDLIGQPSDQSLPGFIGKLGWKQIHGFPYLIFLRPTSWLRRRGRRPAFRAERVTSSGDLGDYFSLRQKWSDRPAGPALTSEFLDWRVFS